VLLIHAPWFLMCIQFYVSFIWLHVHVFAIHSIVYCGSAFEPGASGLPYYCASTCARSCCTWRASCVDSKPNKQNPSTWSQHTNIQIHPLQNNIHVSKFHRGSAFEPGASWLPYYCTPPVCGLDVLSGKTLKQLVHHTFKNFDCKMIVVPLRLWLPLLHPWLSGAVLAQGTWTQIYKIIASQPTCDRKSRMEEW